MKSTETKSTKSNGKSRDPQRAPEPASTWKKFCKRVPQSTIPEGFTCTESGVTDPKGEQIASAPLGVSMTAALKDGSGHHHRIVGVDITGKIRSELIKREMLAQPQFLLRTLADRGFSADLNQGRSLAQYLAAFRPKRERKLVNQPGWVGDPFRNACFAYGRRAIGDVPKAQSPVFQPVEGSRIHEAMKACGDLEKWKAQVAGRVQGLHVPIFALCAGLTPPLGRLLRAELLGYHFTAASSSGKTTLLQLIASMYGRAVATGGDQASFVQSWNTTGCGAEVLAHSCNDLPLVLDELQADHGDMIETIIYILSQGQGKSRMTSELKLANQYRWRVATFSTGELSTREAIETYRRSVRTGQEVRLITIPIESTDFGEGSRELVDALKSATQRSYGTAGTAFIDKLIKLIEPDDKGSWSRKDLRDEWAYYAEELGVDHLSGPRTRVTRFFALAALAGNLACQSDILPFSDEEVQESIAFVHKRWLASASQLTETERAVQAIQDFMLKYALRFVKEHAAGRGQAYSRNRIGWRVTRGDGPSEREYFVFTIQGFKDLCVGAGANFTDVGNYLRKRGLLYTGKEGKNQFSWTTPDKTKGRFYFVAADLTGIDLESEKN